MPRNGLFERLTEERIPIANPSIPVNQQGVAFANEAENFDDYAIRMEQSSND